MKRLGNHCKELLAEFSILRTGRIPTTAVRYKIVGLVLAIAGLAVAMLLLLAAAGIVGNEGGNFGYKRMIGTAVAAGLLLLGTLLLAGPKWLEYVGASSIAAIYLTLSAAILRAVVPDSQSLLAASWILLAYLAAICLLMPTRLGVITFVGILGLNAFFWGVNNLKIALLGLPVTVLDIKIAGANPSGLWNALGVPPWLQQLVGAAAAIVIVVGVGFALRAAYRFAASGRIRNLSLRAALRVLAACLVALLAQSYLEYLYAEISIEDTWDPVGVSKLYDKLGVAPFLAYSNHIEAVATGDVYRMTSAAPTPTPDEVRSVLEQFIDFGSNHQLGPASYPNIVMLLAESTFDVGKSFRLQGKLNDALFVPNQYTLATGPLFVTAVGGGTWITEFETIVGLDSRIFGYSGYYTHSSLSPFVERSIATYLRERGYRTSVWLPHDGEFYNARRAYQSYGFDTIFDIVDVGRDKRGWLQTDVEIIGDFVRLMGQTPPAPFFSYVLSLENHAPHQCRTGTRAADFRVRFVDTEEFQPNCVLHEYLRRLDSTTAAVEILLHYLADLETRTGRPFVLLVFGDHQPHTFTSTGNEVQYDFNEFRRNSDKNITFFHIFSTASTRLRLPASTAPPATVLPTLVSSFLAKAPEDVYLGLNLWLYAHCGSDAVGRQFPGGLNGMNSAPEANRSAGCSSAYDRALAGYRNAGVFRFSFDTRAR